ncbi:MAG: hypothetical protein IPO36_05275 [Anaerolineales bacterium]|nr:hypothetical protein [Anaerolineales bacterium]
MIGSIYSFTKVKFRGLINIVLGFIVAVLMIGLSNSIFWLTFYSNENSIRLEEIIFNPLLTIQKLITATVLVYMGWQINNLAIFEFQK